MFVFVYFTMAILTISYQLHSVLNHPTMDNNTRSKFRAALLREIQFLRSFDEYALTQDSDLWLEDVSVQHGNDLYRIPIEHALKYYSSRLQNFSGIEVTYVA